jgi:hypothetical protein
MRERSRPMLTVRGIDPEMGKAIKPLSASELVDAPDTEKTREESGVAMPIAVSTLDRPAPRKSTALRQARETGPVAAGFAPCDDAVTIWLALYPLQCHAGLLNAFRAQGVDMLIIFRLAWQSFSDNLSFEPRYTKPEPSIWWRAHVHRKRIKLPASLLSDISRDARDFGALKPSELVAGQIQRQWIDALDKVIARVESEV